MNENKLSPAIAYIFANKMYLFSAYVFAFVCTEQSPYGPIIGVPLMIVLLYGQSRFLSHT